MSNLTLSSREKHLFYSVHTLTRIRQHYFSKYWGDQCMGRPPTSNFLGDRPPVPLGLRLWHTYIMYVYIHECVGTRTQKDMQRHTHIHSETGNGTRTYTEGQAN